MRTVLLCALLAGPTAALATDGSPRFHVSTGVGAPEILHGEVGYFATPRLSVELRAANAVLNPMLGAGVTSRIGQAEEGDSPRHAFELRLHGMVNPTLGGLRLTSAGDTFGAYAAPTLGYGFLAKNGFTLRASVGALVSAARFGDQPPAPEDDVPPLPSGVTAIAGARRADFGLEMGPQLSVSLGWAF